MRHTTLFSTIVALLDHPSKECETNTITMDTSVSYVIRAYKKRLEIPNAHVTVIHKFYTCIDMLCVVLCCAVPCHTRAQSSYDKILYSTHTPELIWLWLWLWNDVFNGYMEGKNVEARGDTGNETEEKERKKRNKKRKKYI